MLTNGVGLSSWGVLHRSGAFFFPTYVLFLANGELPPLTLASRVSTNDISKWGLRTILSRLCGAARLANFGSCAWFHMSKRVGVFC